MQAPGTDANHELGQTVCCLCNQTHTHGLTPAHTPSSEDVCTEESTMFSDKPVTKGVSLSPCLNGVMALDSLSAGLPVSVVLRGLTISSVCVYDYKECGLHLA